MRRSCIPLMLDRQVFAIAQRCDVDAVIAGALRNVVLFGERKFDAANDLLIRYDLFLLDRANWAARLTSAAPGALVGVDLMLLSY